MTRAPAIVTALVALAVGGTTAACGLLIGVDWDRVTPSEDGATSSSETGGPIGTDGASGSEGGEGGDGSPGCVGRRCPPGCAVGQLMTCGRGTAGIACALSTGTSFGAFPLWQASFSNAAGWSASASNYGTLQFADVNGDGKADVCGRGVGGVGCALSTGTSFVAIGAWQTSFFDDASGSSASPAYYGTIQFPDINGDGKADLCGRGVAGMSCALSTGVSFSALSVWDAGLLSDAAGWKTSPAYYATIQFPDVNGDGKADVCGRGVGGVGCALSTGTSFGALGSWNTTLFDDATGWLASPSLYATIQFPDVNGDGKADVCGRGVNGISRALSTGTSFGDLTLWNANFSNAGGWNIGASYYATIQFPDINGDGKADVCGRGGAGVVCALSNGTSFVGAGVQTNLLGDPQGWATTPAYYGTIQFPDIDNDGKADVCGRGGGGIECAVSTGASFGALTHWQVDLSDALGWLASPSNFTTIRFPVTSRGDCTSGVLSTPPLSPAARFGI